MISRRVRELGAHANAEKRMQNFILWGMWEPESSLIQGSETLASG